ncbi:CLUMA_CG021652, isoform A [Clunio marinus]|uniref:CLUMA_CG021652, isoform A n=1 Tax=Clunio marinus TaxID=568069 RepID=A0A1J1J8G9_9DIPT|nr:CLUMA_CG021652, isoform A [Clunio marinus]
MLMMNKNKNKKEKTTHNFRAPVSKAEEKKEKVKSIFYAQLILHKSSEKPTENEIISFSVYRDFC